MKWNLLIAVFKNKEILSNRLQFKWKIKHKSLCQQSKIKTKNMSA